MKILKFFIFSLIVSFGIMFTANVQAQCPMCKANVESTMHSGGKKTGMGLNKGIYILLAMPYILVGLFGAIYYVQKRKWQTRDKRGFTQIKR